VFFILRLSYILKLGVIFYTVHAVPSLKHGKCEASFQGSTKEKVESKITDRVEDFIKEYGGQKGCVQFSKNLKAEMSYIYQLVSKSLTKDQMSRLNWQRFKGTAEEFLQLRVMLLNANGEPKEEYIGMKGYAALAEQHYQGDMEKTFKNVSAVLDKREMKRLGWKQFKGKKTEFSQLSGRAFE